MAVNKKAILATLKHPVTLVKVMMRCKDKTDVERYERLLDDDNFLGVQANRDALMMVVVTDTTLWGGDLWLAFLPNENDADFMYGFGVSTAYHCVIDLLACGIRESNPVISWIRHFFATRTSPNQKIDSVCLHALTKSLLPLHDAADVDKLYEVAEAVKSIPCEAWGDFQAFYPYYKDLVEKYSLMNILEESKK